MGDLRNLKITKVLKDLGVRRNLQGHHASAVPDIHHRSDFPRIELQSVL